MSEIKRFTSYGNRIKRDGTLLNIHFETKTDAKLCCKLLNQMDKDQQEYIDKLNEIFEWHKEHYGKSILAERLEFKSDCEKENERMANKLNELALEFLNHNIVSMEKAVEISEMSYHDFLKYRKENGNPMELQL